MTPTQYFFLTLAITTAAAAAEAVRYHRRRRLLRELGRRWEMLPAMNDRLGLSDRVACQLPMPGASRVCVRDLLFSTDLTRHRYLFTVEYGLGAVRGKRRRVLVGGFSEPIARGAAAPCQTPLTLAPPELAPKAAYEYVFNALAQAPGGA